MTSNMLAVLHLLPQPLVSILFMEKSRQNLFKKPCNQKILKPTSTLNKLLNIAPREIYYRQPKKALEVNYLLGYNGIVIDTYKLVFLFLHKEKNMSPGI